MSRRRNEILGRVRTRSLRVRGNSANPGNATIRRIMFGSATYNAGNLIDAAGETTTVTVTGADLGDFALASLGIDVAGISVTAYVSAANTVSVRLQNESGGALDLASTSLKVLVIKADQTAT